MGEMARLTEEQLEILATRIPGARLHRLAAGKPRTTKEILPGGIDLQAQEEPPPGPLPAMTAVVEGRKVNLEFSPARDPDTYWMNLYVSGRAPVQLTLTAVNTAGFTRSGPVAQQSFHSGDERFDALYDAMSSTPDRALPVLQDPANRERILAMGEIERLTLESRFVRLIRLVDVFSDIEAEGLHRTILEMAQFATHLEESAASTTA